MENKVIGVTNLASDYFPFFTSNVCLKSVA